MAVPVGMSLRLRLLGLWGVSSLLLVGVFVLVLTWQFREVENEARWQQASDAFRLVHQRLAAAEQDLTQQAGLLARRKDLVAAVYLVDAYGDGVAPAVLDPEKQALARLLARQARTLGLGRAVLYDDADRPVAWHVAPDQTGYVSVAGDTRTPMGLTAAGPARVTWPWGVREMDRARGLSPGPDGLSLAAEAPVRRAPSGPELGRLRVDMALDAAWLDLLGREAGRDIALIGPGGDVTGGPPALALAVPGDAPPLDSAAGHPLAIGDGAAFARLAVAGGAPAHVAILLPMGAAAAMLRPIAVTSALVAALAVALILPLGAWLLDRQISRPLSRLHRFIQALEAGESPPLPRLGAPEIRELGETLRAMSHRLGQRERDLREAVSLLSRANAELERFIELASHDLQEPLRTISKLAQLLQRQYQGHLDPEADELIRFVVEEAHHMQQLIRDLLTYARLGQGHRRPEAVDLQAVVRATVDTLKARIDETHAQIHAEGLPTVPGSRSELAELLRHLVSNALTFHRPEVPPRIRITATDGADGWCIRVIDNGIGIAPEHRHGVFDIFHRLHTRAEYPGTGIGLALCRTIVERHGGAIWIEDAPEGPGTTVAFRLPPVQAPDAS